jgi:predicted extracellular nuclease
VLNRSGASWRLSGIVFGLAVSVAATACSGGSGTTKKPSAPAALQHPKSLVGVVGHNDAFSISLSDEAGNAINNLAAGTYSLAIKDESTIHDFHLTGAGVDKTTGIGGTSTTTFSVTFKPGKYSFVCDPHASSMHGSFTVT